MPEIKDGEERIYMKITGIMVQILIDMAPEYRDYVVFENGKRVIYVKVLLLMKQTKVYSSLRTRDNNKDSVNKIHLDCFTT